MVTVSDIYSIELQGVHQGSFKEAALYWMEITMTMHWKTSGKGLSITPQA